MRTAGLPPTDGERLETALAFGLNQAIVDLWASLRAPQYDRWSGPVHHVIAHHRSRYILVVHMPHELGTPRLHEEIEHTIAAVCAQAATSGRPRAGQIPLVLLVYPEPPATASGATRQRLAAIEAQNILLGSMLAIGSERNPWIGITAGCVTPALLLQMFKPAYLTVDWTAWTVGRVPVPDTAKYVDL
jgi:hypothetical protein